MADISAKQVNELRQRTGVGMMKCKDALVKTNGDMEAAVTLLREQGLAAADKKANRIAAEGAIAIATVGDATAMVEVNAETDFVAKNEKFVTFANTIAEIAAKENPADLEALMAMEYPGFGGTVEDKRKDMILVIGENINVRRFARMEGACSSYIHDKGRIGVIVKFTEPASCGKFVAMQVASMAPKYLDRTQVPAEDVEKETEIIVAQIKNDPKNANKPENIIKERMVPGKLEKFYAANCLVDQEYFIDDSKTVGKFVASEGSARIVDFVRYERGEGIQKREDNFAAEVASMIK
mgnify:FL=1